MLAKTDYSQLLEMTFTTPVKNIFGNYYIDQKGQVYYNTRPLTPNWRKSRSGAIYYTFRLWRNKKIETYYIHRLMASCWLGDIAGMTVNHIDGNPANNELWNLEICSMLENCHHKIILRRNLKIVRFENGMEEIKVTSNYKRNIKAA